MRHMEKEAAASSVFSSCDISLLGETYTLTKQEGCIWIKETLILW